jgi:uncharacterized protein DUF4384
MLLALLLLVQNPVTVRVNHDQYNVGEHARVYVQSAQDGYLIVLHADPEGRIRVLFPLDPTDDDFVRGGKKFEVRGRGDRDAFQIESSDGSGTVLAAVAPDAFKLDSFTRNDHWDFRALGGPSAGVKDDPLARLLDIVHQMAGDSAARFDYDYATYVVTLRGIASRNGYGWGYGLYHPFYDPFCYDPFYAWSASCYTFGVGMGFRGGYGGFGFGFPIYRPYRPYRPYIITSTPGPRFLIPNRPSRYAPIEARPRATERPDIGPRFNGPGPSRPQPKASGGGNRPAVSRGFGGGSRPTPRAGGVSRGGGGGRRH